MLCRHLSTLSRNLIAAAISALFPLLSHASTIIGSIDVARVITSGSEAGSIELLGWGAEFTQGQPNTQPVTIKIYLDQSFPNGTLVAQTSPNIYRPDVNQAFGITGNNGFRIVIPANVTGYTVRGIYAYAFSNSNSAHALINGPVGTIYGTAIHLAVTPTQRGCAAWEASATNYARTVYADLLSVANPTFTGSLNPWQVPCPAMLPPFTYQAPPTVQQRLDVRVYGDSMTQLLGTSQSWVKAIASKYRAKIFGVGGDLTQNLLWRIQNGNAPTNLKSCSTVVWVGTNNIGLGNTPQQAFDGVKSTVYSLRQRDPQTKIILMAMIPRGGLIPYSFSNFSGMNTARIALNNLMRSFAQSDGILFVDASPPFLLPNGSLNLGLLDFDGGAYVHPNALGYSTIVNQYLAPAIQSVCPVALRQSATALPSRVVAE